MGWNPFKSKTKYYVSSSTFPLFDDKNRIDNYEAAILDYTSNSSIEQSEYLKNYYSTSRLRDIRGLLNWADSSGYHRTMGKVSATFYADAQLDNEILTIATKQYVSINPNDTYRVYKSNLNIFSEDFWLKHLATQQGKAQLFYESAAINYTVSFPTEDTIRATFKNGTVIEGRIPNNASRTRFIEMEYSIITETITDKVDAEGNVVVDPETGKPVKITTYTYQYGYYDYQEGSGNTTLDNLIKNNGITGSRTFYPVIPVRTNTSWYSGTSAEYIGKALKQLHLYDAKLGPKDSYGKLQNILIEGINKSGKGSLDDIDYMTIILGVSINSRNKADQRYMFEFFYNIYVNYKLMNGETPQGVSGGLPTYSGQGNLKKFFGTVFKKIGDEGSTGFTRFTLYNASSNLNLIYDWGHAEYFEANGKWQPKAKVGEYGVLAGLLKHAWSEYIPKTDSEGNLIYIYNEDTGRNELQYEVVQRESYINETLFCYQSSENRWHFVMFAGLGLTNLVYAGKTVYTDAYDAVKESDSTNTLQYSFKEDSDGTYDEYTLFNFSYVENSGREPSAFIVPLEQSTFYEIGVPYEVDISYGCQYLVCNCWEKKKVRWYQHGWFSVLLSFTVAIICPIGIVSVIFFTIGVVLLTAQILELTQKILCTIFGESLGNSIYKWSLAIIKTILIWVATICFKIPVIGWIIWAICITVYATITAAEYLRAGYSLEQAIMKGAAEGAIAGVASLAGGYVGGTVSASYGSVAGTTASGAVSGFISGTGSSLIAGNSLGKSLKTGAISGAISGVAGGLFQGVSNLWNGNSFLGTEIIGKAGTSGVKQTASNELTKNFLVTNAVGIGIWNVMTNPMTYMNLINLTMAEQQYHKMANLENDYQEFADKYAAANRVLDMLNQMRGSTVTAEFVCKMQACLGRMIQMFPDAISMSPEAFLSMATTTGHDQLKSVLGSVTTFVDSQLSMDGYEPYQLFYTQMDYSLTFTETSTIIR